VYTTPRTIVGQLSGDANFEVSFGNDTVTDTTSGAGTSTSLIDAGQNFLADGKVKPGDTVFNLTDGSKAKVVSVANGSLTTTPLTGGTDNTWDAGDAYRTAHLVTVRAMDGSPATDINVTQRLGGQAETAIAVNPTDPTNMIIGANDNNNTGGIFGSPSQDSVWVTTDGGQTWTREIIPLPAGGLASHGDPTVVFDRTGRAVYAHLIHMTPEGLGADGAHGGSGGNADDDHVLAVAVSTDKGANWTAHVVTTVDADAFTDDKEYLAVGPDVDDPDQDRFVVVWHERNVIYSSTSTDGGETWSAPVIVSNATAGSSTDLPRADTAIDSVPAFGPNGEIYVVWENYSDVGVSKIMFDISLDGGETWGLGGQEASVFFDTGLSNLTDDDKVTLDAFAALLEADESIVVTIEGHTDTAGLSAANQTLSDNRALAVFNYLTGVDLTSPHTIAASRLTQVGFGEALLAFDTGDRLNDGVAGTANQANRRVDLTIDRLVYTGNVNVFRDQFGGGLGLDGVDETNSPAGQGEYEIPAQPARGVWMGVSIDVDRSGGDNDGRIYVSFADQGDLDDLPDAGSATDHHDLDVFVIASDDLGATWDALGASLTDDLGIAPKRVNFDDAGTNSQFFAWLDVDQASGNVAISWYDARNDTNDGAPGDTDTTSAANDEVQYFASFSTDGGNTWTVNRLVSDGVSDGGAAGGNNFLDYTGLAFFNDTIHMAWADNSDSTGDNPDGPGGPLDVYYDRIPLRNLTIDDLIADINFAIAQLDALDGKIVAQAIGNKVKLAVIDPALTSLKITTTNADPAFRDLGIQQSIDLAEADGEVLEFTSSRNAPTFVGQLTHDATFTINFAGGSSTEVTVEQGATVSSFASNRNILDLVFDVQGAIDEALVHGTATAGSTGTTLVHDGQDFDALETAGEIGIGDIILNVTTGAVGTITGIGGDTLTTSTLTGGAGGDNTWGASDLYRINPIEVGSETGRLLFTRIGATTPGTSDNFTVTETTTDSAAELGITSTLASDEADLLIVESDGVTKHRIALDQVSTIAQLITAINTQSGGAIVASLTVDDPNGEITPVNEAKTGLTITESGNPGVFSATTSAGTGTTLNDSGQNFLANGLAKPGDTIYNLSDGSKATIVTLGNGTLTTTPLSGGSDNTWQSGDSYSLGKFKVGITNGSLAAIQLGLIGTDTNPQDDADVPDGRVVGATIAGATLLDRFFISTPGADTNADSTNDPDLLNEIIHAHLEVKAGALLSAIKIDAVGGGKTTITAGGFDFTRLDQDNNNLPDSPVTLEIKNVAGFTPGVYSITDIIDDDTIKLGSTAIGVAGQQGGAGVLNTGLDASAIFGFIEIGLNGTAEFGAKLSWGFNTADGTPGADGRLTAQEVIDAISEPLTLMLLPDLTPIPVMGTTTGAGATTLTDAGAQFQARKRVAVGDVVRNISQNKTATVASIDSDTQLTLTALSGGGSWANGDDYEIGIRNFGVVDADVSLDLAGGLSGLATAVGLENPELALRVLALGDPFIGTRFDQADYTATTDANFTLDGDFTSKLPVGATLRFGDEDFTIATANFASGTTTVTVTPVEDGDALPDSLDDVDVVLLPKVEVDISDLGDILPDFQNFGLADILALLQALAGYLSQFESFGFLNEPLPLIDTSVNDLLGFADDFAQALQEFQANPAGSLQLLEDKLLESLGLNDDTLDDIVDFVNDGPSLPGLTLPSQPVNLEFDVPSGMLKFDLVWGTSFSEGLDIGLPGLDFGSALADFGLGSILDLAGSANLEAEGTVLARLTLGVSVEDFDVDLLEDGFDLAALIEELGDHLFLFDTTGLEARLRVAGEDISFRVGVGPFSLSIGSTDPDGPNPQVASIELDGSIALEFDNSVFDGDGKVSFSDFFGDLSFDIIDTDVQGTIEGYLPVFFPNDTRFIGAIRIGGTDGTDTDPTSGEAYSFTPSGDLVNLVETLIDTGELNFELISEDADPDTIGVQGTLENAIAIDVTDVIEGITSFDLTKLSIFDNILLAVDGLDMVLEMVEDIFDDADLTLPLIGDDLQEAAGFIGDMRDDFIDPLRNLVETAKDAAADFSDPNKNVISKAIFDILGPNGANILRPQEDTTGFHAGDPGYYIGLNTNLDEYLFPEVGDTPPDQEDVFIEWDLNLGSDLVDKPFDIGFDLGIPGLGLETEGDLNILIDWALDLSFGLDFKDGFYIKTDDADELLFNVEVTLPDAGITGTLGFLALTGENTELDFGEFGDKETALGATFKLDISNVVDEGSVVAATSNTLTMSKSFANGSLVGKLVKIVGGDGDDQTFGILSNTTNQLTIDGSWGSGRTPDSDGEFQILDPNMGFTEFGNVDFDPRIAAEASAALDLTLGLSEDLVGADVAAGFPSVHGEFRFLWQLGNRGAGDSAQEVADNPATRFRSFESLGDEGFGAIENGLKLVSIENIALDLGSFISDVLGPIVEEVSKFTEPVQPIIDFITSPVPIIGQLGLDITWLDLAEMLAGDKVNVALIRSITEIISFVNQIAELSEADSVMLPIGDFVIFDATDGGSGFTPALWDGGFDLRSEVDLDNPASLSGIIGNIFGTDSELGDIVSDTISQVLGGLTGGESAQVVQGLTSGQSAGGFSFPFLEDPSQIFGLLMGDNIDLVAYDLGALNFGFEFSQFFSIFGPLGVSIGLDVQIDIDTAFVYDTQGIRDFVESDFRNPLLLFNGFAIAADPRLDGVDDPELRFFAELQAAAELNLGIARAGVAAAFGFEILFNLFDPDDDGRIRITELVGNIENQLRAPDDADKLLAPLAIFDISGEIFARLFAFLEIDFGFFSFEKEFPIFGPETLLSFEVDFFRPPILASELDNGDLLIHAGEFADQRLLGEATDISEHIKINKVSESGGTITLTVQSTGASTGGDSLGDDSEVALEYKMKKGGKIIFDGGKGNDRLEVTNFGVGDALFEVDMGVGDDEVLLSGGIADKFSTIIGGKGKDEITGSAGADLIIGGQGDDTVHAGDGKDLVFGDEGEVGTNSATGKARPTDGVDIIDGEGGSDILFGGGGRDQIDGGTGGSSDLLIGGEGVVFFQPGAFKEFANVIDLLQDGVDDVENLALDKSAGDVLTGDAGDIIYGTAGPDVITGTGENDIIFGMGGADVIDGLGGNDIIFGDGGKLDLGAGGSGTATSGDANTLTDAGADFSSVKVGDYVWNLSEDRFVRVTLVNSGTSVDTEPVTSWSGDLYKFFVPVPVAGTADSGDTIEGGTGDDLIFGGGGNDFLAGDAIETGVLLGTGGADQLFGGGGADKIFGDNVQVDGNGKTAIVPVVSGAGADRLFGQGENDVLYGGGGFDYLDGGAGSDRAFGGNSSDTLIFTKGEDRLDGEDGGDGYFAIMQGGNNETLAIAQDTGTTGADLLVVQGTVLRDQFLLRANTAGTDAFIAMIKNASFVERINYGGSLERILVNGSFGDDQFAVDDTAAEITINGEFGDDTFQVGQIFRSQRTPAEANIKVNPFDDTFATIETTRGFLSNGISEPMTINGGLGNDLFTVFHNKAVLQLNGEGGDDTFEIRAFALVGSQEPQRERTDLSGGEGADLVMYVVNAPVNIDGGDGFDTVVVIGTEFGDDFVVTEDGVFGAGLTVSFVNIESLRVDAAEGNDRVFVQSTSEKFITEVFGGLGEDTVFMSGPTPPIVSNDLRGHSGIVTHGVESTDARYDGQHLFGISANVADNDEPFVVLRPTGGSTIITEGGIADEFEVVLTRAPTRAIDVFVFAPLPTPSARERGQQMFRVTTGVPPVEEPTVGGSSVTLTFTTANWDTPQTVYVIADGDLDTATNVFEDLSPAFLPIATRPEIVQLGETGEPPREFVYDDQAFEGVRFGVVNISVKASIEQDDGNVVGLNLDRDVLTVLAADLVNFDATTIIGQNLQIKAGPAMGQNRFVSGYQLDGANVHLTLDRPYSEIEFPDNTSAWIIQDDDSLVGKMDSFREDTADLIDDGIIPEITDPNDDRSIFVDADGSFVTDAQGQGLVGAVLEIVAGAGLGQQQLVLGHGLLSPETTLILAGQWRTNPDETSIYRIERYDGLALPSVLVQVNDNDLPGLVVDETRGFEDDGDGDDDAGDVVDDYDTITAVIEGGDGDHLGERDIIHVHLSTDPAGTVEVGLIYDPVQLEVRKLDGTLITNEAGHRLSFTDTTAEDLVVTALVDGLREGFHTSLISFELHSSLVDDDVEITEHFQTFTDFPVFFLGLENAPELDEDITVLDDGVELDRVFAPDVNGVFVGGDYFVVDNKIVFVDPTGDPFLREGFIDVTYTFVERDFDGAFTQPVLARINDLEAPTVIVRETGGTTDVVEVNDTDALNPNFIFGGVSGSPWEDTYQLVLSAQPDDDVIVTVTPQITKTTRTGGIRHDDVQVELSSSDGRAELLDFTADAAGGSTTELLDTDATFISDGVKIGTLVRIVGGDWVHVVDVVNEHELTTEAVAGGWNSQNYTFGNWKVTFSDADWDDPVEFLVRAIDDDQVDGQDTQVFKPGPATLSGILGPVVLEGAGGAGSLSLGIPVMLPGETNLRAPNGTVAGFTAGTGLGATESMTVYEEDLQAFVDADDAEGDKLETIDDLIGLTIEMARGHGVGVQLNPDRPQEAYDRFWLIEDINPGPTGDLRILTLKNPSQVDPSALPTGSTPIADPSDESFVDLVADGDDPTQAYAITALSANFFVEETVQVDFVFVNDQDSPADSSGVLTSTRLYGLNMGPDLVIGGALRPGGITYDDFEVLEINLGKGNNNLEVIGTHTREDAYRTWTLINTGDETVEFADEMGDDVVLHLNAEDELFEGTVQGAANNAFTTTITVEDHDFEDGELQGALISIGQAAGEDTDATGQVRRILNNVGSVLTVDRAWAALPTDESYTITNEADGPVAVNLQLGDDSLDASDSDLGIVAFGGLGSDTLIGGEGDDILFGDRGRVDYFNEIGAIVTRLGDAPEPITGFVTAQVVEGTPGSGETDLFTIEDTGTKLSGGVPIGGSFPVADTDGNEETGTEDIGLRGLYVDINNGFGFLQPVKLISGNDATHLFLSTLETDAGFDLDLDLPGPVAENPAEYRISTIPEDQTDGVVRDPTLLLTVDNALGDVDTIVAGGGQDTVFGGAGGDTIDAGDDEDTVVGDAGRVDRKRGTEASGDLVVFPPRAPEAPMVPTFVERVRTIEFGVGGEDVISGGAGADLIFGGAKGDTIHGNDGTDAILGDNGETIYAVGSAESLLTDLRTTDSTAGTTGIDDIHGDGGTDLALGGFRADTIHGGADADILVGDAAEVLYGPDGITIVSVETIQRSHAGNGDDRMHGDAGDDIVSGGSGSDDLDGGANDDLIFGDNVLLVLVPDSGNAINPRFRQLGGATIYSASGEVQVAPTPAQRPGGNPAWGDWDFTLDQTFVASHFGDDYIAGGAHDDQVFGQLGDDTIQGDGSIDFPSAGNYVAIGGRVGAIRDGSNALLLNPSFESGDDGDDYIEGNRGTDVIFGNLGQDDIVGGSSNLFSLTDYNLRPDGKDYIFGGAGTDAGRNDLGDLAIIGHARDSDVILGDNGNIYRLVSAGSTAYLTFNYDDYGAMKIVPRAAQLLDYTPGGPDYTSVNEPLTGPADIAINPVTGLRDIGAGDEVHGESGDDFIYGMLGRDVLFGDGQDDNMVGGYDADWMSGGAGDDGMLGDDGRLFASRNGAPGGEPLYGIAALSAGELNTLISTPGGMQQATINVAGMLKYTADLTPDNLDPAKLTPPNVLFRPLYANDVIYGGWGNDSIHSGAGDDAISGAEAPAESYTNNYDQGTGSILLPAVQRSDFFHPLNPGNVLGYQPGGVNATKFALYDATKDEGMRKILLNNDGTLNKNSTGKEWILNFTDDGAPLDAKWAPGTGYSAVATDGDDHLFGDLGNDWMVGGTGRDVMFSGWGDDLMNADDYLGTNGGLNNSFDAVNGDTNPSHEDLAFGGAGRDVIILNTNGDRGIDWLGEFNTFLTPYAQFGAVSVSRLLQPQVPEFLYALSKSAGADMTLAALYGGAAARNGEPFGELGLIVQQDAAWQAQSGGPRDPQAGNTNGGKVDVKNNPGTTNLLPIYMTAETSGAGMADYLTDAQLSSQVAEATRFWTQELGAGDSRLDALGGLRIEVGNLPDDRLGATLGNWILIDSDAAGHGWSVGSGDSAGRMDLLTVLTHEIGHALGFGDDDARHGVMDARLESGTSYVVDRQDPQPGYYRIGDRDLLALGVQAPRLGADDAWNAELPGFDLGYGMGAGRSGSIDWQAQAGDGWSTAYTPYAPAKSGKGVVQNVSDFLVKLAKGGTEAAAKGGFDSLGASFFGAKGKGGKSARV
jgi:Ca2+-binding RTX toxin-like protein